MVKEIRGMSFTKDQAAAVETLDTNLAINAGAGSGKTRVLTERFLEILLDDSKNGLYGVEDALDKVIAITFTRKAASEMKERIRKRFEEYLEEEEVNKEEEEWIFSILDNLNQARISTIHSFCRDILEKYTFKLPNKIPLDFEMIEGREVEELKEEAIMNVINQIKDTSKDLYQGLAELLYSYGQRDFMEIFNSMLEKRNRMESLLDIKDSSLNLETFINNSNLDVVTSYLNEKEIAEQIEEIREYQDQLKDEFKEEEVTYKLVKVYDQLRELGKKYLKEHDKVSKEELLDLHCQFLECFYDFKEDKKISHHRSSKADYWKGGNKTKKKVKAIHKSLRDRILDLIPQNNVGFKDQEDQESLDILNLVLEFYQLIKVEYDKLKSEENYLDFLDLEELVVELYNNNHEVVKELRDNIDFIMVDEFQDTNQMQWDIIRPLVTTDENYETLADNKLFVVGDPKQSIYGFRRANIEIFEEVLEKIDKSTKQKNLFKLQDNFRSNQGLIDFTNQVFDKLMNSQEKYNVGYKPLNYSRDKTFSKELKREKLDSEIEILITSKEEVDKEDEMDAINYEAQFMADKIKELIEDSGKKVVKSKDQTSKLKLLPIEYGDIAILIRSRTQLKNYEAALERANIPYQTISGRGFYKTQEIYDIYLVLKSLVCPDDDKIAFGVMRSPLFAISDDELFDLQINKDKSLLEEVLNKYPKFKKKYEKWIEMKNQVSLDELITTILIDCQAYGSYLAGGGGEQRIANLEKLIEEAAEFSYQSSDNLYQFVARLGELINSDVAKNQVETADLLGADRSDKVKIMTIHAAKGKEFPVVFLPDLNSKGRSNSDKVICDQLKGKEYIGFKYYNQDLEEVRSNNYSILKNEIKEKELMEEIRTFYVAITRAEDSLFLSANIGKEGKKSFRLHKKFKWLIENVLEYDIEDFLTDDKEEEQLKLGNSEIKINKNPMVIGEDNYQLDFARVEPDFNKLLTIKDLKVTKEVKTPSDFVSQNYKAVNSRKKQINILDDNTSSALKGTIVHRAIELMILGEELDVDYLFNVYPEHKNYANLKEEIREIIENIKSCLKFRDIINRECKPEVEFYLEEEEYMINGIIDLIFKDDNNQWAVVDWKTNKIDDIEELVEKYRPQIEIYQQAIKEMTGQDEVKGYLYFTEASLGDRLVEVI